MSNRTIRNLAATLLCELGKVSDPRIAGVESISVAEVTSRQRTFSPGPNADRPLTDAEADAVLTAYFAIPYPEKSLE